MLKAVLPLEGGPTTQIWRNGGGEGEEGVHTAKRLLAPSFSHVEGGGREVPGGRTRNATHLAVINVCERNDIDVDFGGMIDAREGV